MYKNSKVSIIIPTYNRAHLIHETLKSIGGQTYENIEIVIVDDGSTDKSKEIISDFIAEYRGAGDIKYVFQPNLGAAYARNNGLNSTTGNYVVFFDSDDLMLPDRIEKQYRQMVVENSDCCACGFFYNTVGGKSYIPPDVYKSAVDLNIDTKLFGSTQCWMFKKEIVRSVGGYDVDLLCKQDWDLTFRILSAGAKVSVVQEPLSIFVSHDGEERIMLSTKNVKGLPSIFKYHFKVIEYGIKRRKMAFLRKGVRNLSSDVSGIFKQDKELSWSLMYKHFFDASANLRIIYKVLIFILFSCYFVFYQVR